MRNQQQAPRCHLPRQSPVDELSSVSSNVLWLVVMSCLPGYLTWAWRPRIFMGHDQSHDHEVPLTLAPGSPGASSPEITPDAQTSEVHRTPINGPDTEYSKGTEVISRTRSRTSAPEYQTSLGMCWLWATSPCWVTLHCKTTLSTVVSPAAPKVCGVFALYGKYC